MNSLIFLPATHVSGFKNSTISSASLDNLVKSRHWSSFFFFLNLSICFTPWPQLPLPQFLPGLPHTPLSSLSLQKRGAPMEIDLAHQAAVRLGTTSIEARWGSPGVCVCSVCCVCGMCVVGVWGVCVVCVVCSWCVCVRCVWCVCMVYVFGVCGVCVWCVWACTREHLSKDTYPLKNNL